MSDFIFNYIDLDVPEVIDSIEYISVAFYDEPVPEIIWDRINHEHIFEGYFNTFEPVIDHIREICSFHIGPEDIRWNLFYGFDELFTGPNGEEETYFMISIRFTSVADKVQFALVWDQSNPMGE